MHGFTRDEQDRLYHQARFLEHRVHEGLPLRRVRDLGLTLLAVNLSDNKYGTEHS